MGMKEPAMSDYRPRLHTLPEPMTLSHAEVSGSAVRVRERSPREEESRVEYLRAHRAENAAARLDSLDRRIYDVVEEQIFQNTRVSRLEQRHNEGLRAMNDAKSEVQETRHEMMKRFDEAVRARRKQNVRELAYIVGIIAAAAASIIAATRGAPPPPFPQYPQSPPSLQAPQR